MLIYFFSDNFLNSLNWNSKGVNLGKTDLIESKKIHHHQIYELF